MKTQSKNKKSSATRTANGVVSGRLVRHEHPNIAGIIRDARRMGLKKPRVQKDKYGLWELVGEGTDRGGWPRAWRVAEKLGMGGLCGNHNQHYINPDNYQPLA